MGWGRVHPNPMVGCVLARGDEVVGEGFHAEFGRSHAEIVALAEAGDRSFGAAAFVTLEPCAHLGKTPSCARALYNAGIERVVFGAADPGPGAGGAQWLESRGIPTTGPVWSARSARTHNPAFFHEHGPHRRGGRSGSDTGNPKTPYLAIKLAMSLDARIAAKPGETTRITGDDAQVETHRLRSGFDAIVVGSGTALVDDPSLTVRRAAQGRPPARVVVDSRALLPPTARMATDGKAPVHVLTTKSASPERVARLEAAGVRVHRVPGGDEGRVDLRAALVLTWRLGMRSLLCEGGGALASGFLEAGLASHVYLFTAPKLLGGRGVPAFPDGERAFPMAGASVWRPVAAPRRLGEDLLQVFETTREDLECSQASSKP